MKENEFQAKIIRRLKQEFPECIVLKNDANYIQGIPDLILLDGERWAALEVKVSSSASIRPNQEYYIDIMNRMSIARFVNPDNLEEVLHDIQRAFRA